MVERTRKSKPMEKPAQPTAARKPGRAKKTSAPAQEKPTAAAKGRPARKTTQKVKESSKPIQKLTTFELEAPQAQEVHVAGCFNNWDPVANPLERLESGTWIGTVSIEPGEHQYRFIVDGEWRDDPVNTLRCWNEYGTQNCVLIIEE